MRNNPISRTDFLGLWEDGGDDRDGGDDYDIPEIEVTDTRPDWYKEMMQSMDLVENLGTDYEDWNYQNERRDDGGRDPDSEPADSGVGYPHIPLNSITGIVGVMGELANIVEKESGKSPFIKTMKWGSKIGWAGEAISVTTNFINIYNNPSKINVAKFSVSVFIASLNTIPLVGSLLSFSFSAIDAGGGFNWLYKGVENYKPYASPNSLYARPYEHLPYTLRR